MFEKFFSKIKKFFKKNDFEKKGIGNGSKENHSSSEQSDSTLGNVSGGQNIMQPGSHGPK